ncbi:MAG TPA: hypothetical protein VOB72_24005, partial [Candidatus Dormibacteraeota bacterium]|nr:hypothetical protein [Candidatus Dormibacteraeota bacterium]
PCTPSRGPASAVLGHAVDGAPCAPRRRPTIWGTWPPNLSPAFPARPLARPLLLAGGFGAVALIGVAVIVGFPTYLAAQRGLGSAAAGAATSLVPLSSIAGSLLAGWLLGRGARLRTLAPFALAFPVATSLAFWAALPSAANVAAGMAVLAANGVLVAAIFASAPDVVADARDIDVTNGLLAQFGSLGNLVGPPLFAAAVAHGGWATMGPATLPVAAAALGLLLAASVSPAGRASPHPRSVPPRPPARR